MNTFMKHTCSLMLFDLSGFTQLIYQASRSEGLMRQVISSVQQVFDAVGSTAASSGGVKILITTGDGFIATASDPENVSRASA